MINPLLKAPDEDKLGDDVDAAFRYRVYYYRNQNVLKQMDAFIDEMEKEISGLADAISRTDAAAITK